MSTYDEILGREPKQDDAEKGYMVYGDRTKKEEDASKPSYLNIESYQPTTRPQQANNAQTTSAPAQSVKATNTPNQSVKANNVGKSNTTLGTPKFDNAITDVLSKKEPTDFTEPTQQAQQAQQKQGQEELTAAQIARAYALSPSTTTDYTQRGEDTKEAERQREKSYAEMLSTLQESMQKYKPLTKDQEEAKKKRDKRNAIISSIGDGLTALANLVATTKGSPNMYDPDNGLSKRYLDYYEKMKAEREAKRNAYQNYQQLLYKLNDNKYRELAARDAANAEAKQKQNSDAQKNMVDKIKLLIEADKAEASGNVAKANSLRAMAQANKYAEDAKWTGAKAKAYIGNQNAAAGAHKAAAVRSYAAAAKDSSDAGSGGRSGGKSGDRSIVLNNGHGTELVPFNSKKYRNLINVLPDMLRVLTQLKGKYANAKLPKDEEAQKKYKDLYDILSKPTLSSNKKMDVIFQNAREFPQLYHHIRQALGVEGVPIKATKPIPKGKGKGSSVMGEHLSDNTNAGEINFEDNK